MQVNPDEDSRQRLKMIRGEIDEPMRSAAPRRTAQQELAQQDAAPAAQDTGAEEPSRGAVDNAAAPAQPQAAPEEPGHPDGDNDSDIEDDGTKNVGGPVFRAVWIGCSTLSPGQVSDGVPEHAQKVLILQQA